MVDSGIDLFVIEALFSTVTNVNFDAERFEVLLSKASEVLQKAKKLYEDACESAGKEAGSLEGPSQWQSAVDKAGLLTQALEVGIEKRTDLDTINNSILVNIYLSLKRAEHQGEKNWLKGITQENVSAGSRLPSFKKESFWSKFR